MRCGVALSGLLLLAGLGRAAAQDPFEHPIQDRAVPPVPAAAPLPANSPQLSVARPYALFTGDAERPAPLQAPVSAAVAADWYRFWTVSLPAHRAGETAAAYAARARSSVAEAKRLLGVRGPVIATGPLPTLLAVPGAGDYVGFTIRPRVTASPAVNTFGVGFLVRLAADLGNRIPLPTLDLRSLKADEAPWAGFWVSDAVRNGIAGFNVLMPRDRAAASVVERALASLRGPNVYLPPPAEACVIVSFDPGAARQDRWDALFRLYAGLRASGVWPNFVAANALRSREASLARYRVIVAMHPLSADLAALTRDACRRGATVVSIGERGARGDRVLAAERSGRPAVTQRTVGEGRWIAASIEPFTLDGAWRGFWQGILRTAGVPNRPWLESVSARHVGIITGKYSRPKPVR